MLWCDASENLLYIYIYYAFFYAYFRNTDYGRYSDIPKEIKYLLDFEKCIRKKTLVDLTMYANRK